MNLTVGKAINKLRLQHGLRMIDLAEVLNINPNLLTKITRDERELSFLMVLRLLNRFDLAIDEFANMLSDKELNRTDLSTIRYFQKKELNRARNKGNFEDK
ncbi:MAG: helix-turn-helix transcriptional regulator [Bacteroidota bacterium]